MRVQNNTLSWSEDVITYFINYLFTGYEVLNTFTFRITRNADLTIHEDGAEDLLIEIERFLKNVRVVPLYV